MGEKITKSREFNNIELKKELGIIRKTSDKTAELREEASWYSELPNNLKHLTPNVLSTPDQNSAALEMEYVENPSLGDSITRGEAIDWKEAIQKLFKVLSRLHGNSVTREDFSSSLRDIYISKTLRRLNEVKELEELRFMFENDTVTVNGKKTVSPGEIYNNLEKYLSNTEILEQEKFTLIHGDFNLSNILYNDETGSLKLVDPRGCFGKYSIRGDPYYDVAKLSQSLYSSYDFMARDMFEIKRDKHRIDYRIDAGESFARARNIFTERLNRSDYQIKKVKAIEAQLFLSMAALHGENVERQKLMLARGSELFDSYVV